MSQGEFVLPGLPEPVVPIVMVGLSADRRRTERQAEDVKAGRHPLTGGKLHDQADMGARVGDSAQLPFRCGSCVHRFIVGHHDRTYPKCEAHEVTQGAATDVRAWWPACPLWEATT